MEKKLQTITTPIISGQRDYILPIDLWPMIRAEVYNRKLKKYIPTDYSFAIVLHNKKRKTDETLKLRWFTNPNNK